MANNAMREKNLSVIYDENKVNKRKNFILILRFEIEFCVSNRTVMLLEDQIKTLYMLHSAKKFPPIKSKIFKFSNQNSHCIFMVGTAIALLR